MKVSIAFSSIETAVFKGTGFQCRCFAEFLLRYFSNLHYLGVSEVFLSICFKFLILGKILPVIYAECGAWSAPL